jgi:hypothetical protein
MFEKSNFWFHKKFKFYNINDALKFIFVNITMRLKLSLIMKKTIWPVLIILTCFVFVQNAHSQKVKFGLKFDPQFSWFATRSSNIESNGSHFGFDGGLVMDYYFEENYALAFGLSINSTGGGIAAKDSFTLEVDNQDYMITAGQELKFSMQYISVPFGFKFKTREFGNYTVVAQIGLTPQFNIGAKLKDGGDIPEGDINPEINLMDLGYHIGAGIHYSLGGNTAIALGVIFKNGFVDVTSNDNFSMVLNTLSIRIGIMF